MRDPAVSKIIELFGLSTEVPGPDWPAVVDSQQCPFLGRRCYKVRKSDASVSIGTCTVLYGKAQAPVVICPTRFLERRQIFVDCLRLLAAHEPGNELHIVQEVTIPGGTVDFFLVSTRNGLVRDFVGIEIQTLDTTGTLWPERQRLLRKLGVARRDDAENSTKTFGMNWKMTAKTILVQLHHKIRTFEHVGKKFVLVIQDELFTYMSREFSFGHLARPASLGDPMHFHVYSLRTDPKTGLERLALDSLASTDTAGIAACLGLQAEARVELEAVVEALQAKISSSTLFSPV